MPLIDTIDASHATRLPVPTRREVRATTPRSPRLEVEFHTVTCLVILGAIVDILNTIIDGLRLGDPGRRGHRAVRVRDLAREAPRRNTTVTVIRTTPEQDAAALASLQSSFPRPLGKIWDNCASTSNEALNATGIPNRPFGRSPVPSPGNLLGTAGVRAREAGGTPFTIPQGSPAIPNGLSQFEPAVVR
jgi:hypothetical protein